MKNFYQNKSAAEMKRVAEIQKREQQLRDQNLAKKIEAKKQAVKTESEMFAKIRAKENAEALKMAAAFETLRKKEDVDDD